MKLMKNTQPTRPQFGNQANGINEVLSCTKNRDCGEGMSHPVYSLPSFNAIQSVSVSYLILRQKALQSRKLTTLS